MTAKLNQQLVLDSITKASLKADVSAMEVGDNVNIHCRIVEGDKERVQVFQGVLIARKGRGINEMITVRRVVDEVGVERKFPLNSPLIAKCEIIRRGDARRAKLYYLRDRVGKSQRLRDRRRRMGEAGGKSAKGVPEPVKA